MYKYRIYGLIFESDIEFDECEKADEKSLTDILIRRSELQDLVDEISEIRQNLTEKQQIEDDFATRYTRKDGSKYLAYVVGIFYLKVSGNNIIEYRPERETDDIVFHQWMLSYAITLALIKRHEIVLHCAGLLVPKTDDAILVCGDSGAGKSTISNALMDEGLLFISDDSVRADFVDGEAKIFGSYLQRRLCEDVVCNGRYDMAKLKMFDSGDKMKWVVNMKDAYYGDMPHKFKTLFFIKIKEFGNPEFKEILGTEKITMLMRALYKTGAYKDEGMSTELFLKITQIAKGAQMYIIERPSDRNTVDEITEKIISMSCKTNR